MKPEQAAAPARASGRTNPERKLPHPARTVKRAAELDRLPPHSEEAEAGVLGCVLLDPAECMGELRELSAEMFYDIRHRTIYSTLLEMSDHREAVDMLTLQQRLKDRQQLDAVGGAAYLSALPDAVPSAANLNYYLKIVRQKHTRRVIIQTSHEAIAQAFDEAADPSALARHASRAIQFAGDQLQPDAKNGFTIRTPGELLAMQFDDADCLLGDRLLATGQSLVIAGAGAIGKSRLLLQLAVASIVGKPFIGLETHAEGRRWLLLQAENSNRRLQHDLRALREWVGPDAWAQVNDLLHVHCLEADVDLLVSLDNIDVLRRLEDAITEIKPGIVAFDSLYNFGIGDLNSDVDMRETLLRLSRVAKTGDPERATVLLHHALTGRAGASKATGYDRASFGRNSKLLHSWTRAQINLAPASPDTNDLLVVSCGKNSNGREFPPFGIKLKETMIYEPAPEFDLDAWQADVGGASNHEPLMTPERVQALCSGPMAKAELAHRIREDCGCARQVAYRYIKKAELARKIRFNVNTGHFTRR